MKDKPDEALFPELEVKRIMFMLLNGLNHIHTNSVVHRDMKPQNCILDKTLNLRIIDFGMAKNVQKKSSV